MPSYIDGQPDGAAPSVGPHAHTGYSSALHGHSDYLSATHTAVLDEHPEYALDTDLGAHTAVGVHGTPQPAAAHAHPGTAADVHAHAGFATDPHSHLGYALDPHGHGGTAAVSHEHAGTASVGHGHSETGTYSPLSHGHTGTANTAELAAFSLLPHGHTGTGGGAVSPAIPSTIYSFSPPTAGLQWVNMPSALAEFTGGNAILLYRAFVDLTNALSARVLASLTATGNTAAPGAYLHAQFSADGAGQAFASIASASISATGIRVGAWSALPAAQRAPGVLRLAGTGGNATADPTFGVIQVQVR